MNTKKNPKPIEYDIHLKYECPKCSNIHWLSFLEASTKNFKVVCDCRTVFTVKRVRAFKIKYAEEIGAVEPKHKKSSKEEKSKNINIPQDLLEEALPVLEQYGFTTTESRNLISNAYQSKQINNTLDLIKYILETLEYEKCN